MTDLERLAEIEARVTAATTEVGLQNVYRCAVEDLRWLCARLRRATDYEQLAEAVYAKLARHSCLALSVMAEDEAAGQSGREYIVDLLVPALKKAVEHGT